MSLRTTMCIWFALCAFAAFSYFPIPGDCEKIASSNSTESKSCDSDSLLETKKDKSEKKTKLLCAPYFYWTNEIIADGQICRRLLVFFPDGMVRGTSVTYERTPPEKELKALLFRVVNELCDELAGSAKHSHCIQQANIKEYFQSGNYWLEDDRLAFNLAEGIKLKVRWVTQTCVGRQPFEMSIIDCGEPMYPGNFSGIIKLGTIYVPDAESSNPVGRRYDAVRSFRR